MVAFLGLEGEAGHQDFTLYFEQLWNHLVRLIHRVDHGPSLAANVLRRIVVNGSQITGLQQLHRYIACLGLLGAFKGQWRQPAQRGVSLQKPSGLR
ncbi:MAG: hypothetical protein CME05_05685 [Gemmatimonadaceae bacterium]|nr:hypothetical protein [Gemmatimonadaceae bacterium]